MYVHPRLPRHIRLGYAGPPIESHVLELVFARAWRFLKRNKKCSRHGHYPFRRRWPQRVCAPTDFIWYSGQSRGYQDERGDSRAGSFRHFCHQSRG